MKIISQTLWYVWFARKKKDRQVKDGKHAKQETFHRLFQWNNEIGKKDIRDPHYKMFPPTSLRKGWESAAFPSLLI